jgi:DnaJ-class molecular chaperone
MTPKRFDQHREVALRVVAGDPDHYEVCPRCEGTGQEPGVPEPHICALCPGSGVRYKSGRAW